MAAAAAAAAVAATHRKAGRQRGRKRHRTHKGLTLSEPENVGDKAKYCLHRCA